MRAVAPATAAWGHQEHLTADLIDVLIAVNGGEQKWPRPGQKEEERSRRIARARRFEERQRARRAGQLGSSSPPTPTHNLIKRKGARRG